MIQLQLSLLMTFQSSIQSARKNMPKLLSVVNSMLNWSQELKLNLNTDKIKVCTFSTWSNNITWQPALFIGNQKVRVNITSTSSLCHSRQDPYVPWTFEENNNVLIIKSLYHQSHSAYFLDWHCSILEIGFHALICNNLNYGTLARQAWLSTTHFLCLDCLKNCSLQLITDQLMSTPLKPLLLEDDV